MTTTHTNIKLVENQIHIFSQDKQTMLFSTDDFYNKIGVEKLDRKHFVKPKVDVEAIQQAYIHKKDLYDRNFMDSGVEDIIKTAFEDGINYNAKEAEFTMKDMEACWLAAQKKMNDFNESGFSKFMNEIQPLSLPKSVTLNENNEVISVEW